MKISEATIKSCMQENNINESQLKDMESSKEPNDAFNCFYGCIMLKENLVSKKNVKNEIYLMLTI